jgi:hypothetical protein
MVLFVNPDDETTNSMARVHYCPPAARKVLPVRGTHLVVGFGVVTVTCDDKTIWTGDNEHVTLYHFEKMARITPGRWVVYFYGPLQGTRYLRTGLNTWELIETDEGFA